MSLKDDIIEMKREVNNVKEQSLAWELLKDSKKANKRICWSFTFVLIVMIIIYFVTVAIFLHNYSQIDCEETVTNSRTQEIDNVNSIENSSIINGDLYGENKAN